MSITRIKNTLSNQPMTQPITQAHPVYQVLTASEGLDIRAG
jgi:hypothetical protein